MQVDVHVLEHQINVLVVLRPQDFLEYYDVWVLQLLQKHYFPVGPLSIRRVRESIEVLFQGPVLFAGLTLRLPDDAVSAAAYFLEGLVER